MPPSDSELLRDYAVHRSEAAFTELVRRHLDLVYAVAKRTLHSESLAADVAQSVFLDLARRARSFRHDATLVAWLHVVTRRTAIDLIRRESRRHAREQSASGSTVMDPTPAPWPQLIPLLDEALSHLGEADRAAVLLRFFENKSLREVGAALGVSDDAAQKRLARALDRLRAFFSRRGLTVTAAALAAELPLHAIETAPTALGASISAVTVAKSAADLSLGSTAIHHLAMTATQKILVATTLVAVLGGLFEAHVIHLRNAELDVLRSRTARLERDLASLRAAHAREARQSAADRDELATLRARLAAFNAGDPAIEDALDSWLQRVVTLRKKLEASPELQISELKYLTAKDWLDATKETKLDTDLEVRKALSQLRTDAKMHFSDQLGPALKRYLKANNGRPPSDGLALAPYFDSPVDSEILQRYGPPTANQLTHTPRMIGKTGADDRWVLFETAPVDDYYDTTFFFGRDGGSGISYAPPYWTEVNAAIRAYRSANNGQVPTAPAQLTPYLHSAIDPSFVQERLKGWQ